MLFFIGILIFATAVGFHILYLDKKNNNILESCSNYENEYANAKNLNSCFISKSLLAKENEERTSDEEKRLLHLSRLI
jgi:hypothetical protein